MTAAPRVWKHWPDQSGDSPLAMRLGDLGDADDRRDGRERRKNEPLEHLVCHMTGSTIVAKAIREGIDPEEKALNYYVTKPNSSHYLIGIEGEMWQMTDERIRVGHVGVSPDERMAYLDGRWRRGRKARGQSNQGWLDAPSDKTVQLWDGAWPKYESPQHLFRGRSINNRSIGSEMTTCVYRTRKGLVYRAEPLRPGMWHTAAQHVAFAMLSHDVAQRHRWPVPWWVDPRGGPRSPRLPGHEDVDLYGRSDRNGGWDTGALRDKPRWDWDFVTWAIKTRYVAGSTASFLTRAANAVGESAVALLR